jgi:hypothetical protein
VPDGVLLNLEKAVLNGVLADLGSAARVCGTRVLQETPSGTVLL